MRPWGFAFAWSSYYKMWAGLNGFDPRNNLALDSVRIGMGCMNLVTVISRYTWVPVTLRVVRHGNGITMQECSLRMFKTINHNHIMLFICYEYVYKL